MSSFNITCICSRSSPLKANWISLELVQLGTLPSISNSYSNLMHFPGRFFRCCWYLINELHKSSCCCGDKSLFSPTLPRDSSVGIATRDGLDGPGIESRWGARFSAHVQTGPGAHPASYTMGTGSFPGVKRPGCGVDHPPHLAPRLKEE